MSTELLMKKTAEIVAAMVEAGLFTTPAQAIQAIPQVRKALSE